MKLTGADILKPGQAYSYNISLTEKVGAAKNDLKSLNLLKDNVLSTTPVEKRRLALGYAENQLPSFALPPDQLTDLKIIHGSCRLQVAGLTDGLAWIDDLIEDNLSDPNQRIHQLLLAGDQIYADDVEVMMLPQMLALWGRICWRSANSSPSTNRMGWRPSSCPPTRRTFRPACAPISSYRKRG